MKLLLLGYRKSDYKAGDEFPVKLPSETEIINSADIPKYLGGDFSYYYDFYLRCERLGLPYSGGWADYPPWVAQLLLHFSYAVTAVENHNIRKSYGRANG
jgi:hypothetical protein